MGLEERDERVELGEGPLSEKVLNGGEDVGVEPVDERFWDVRFEVIVDGP